MTLDSDGFNPVFFHAIVSLLTLHRLNQRFNGGSKLNLRGRDKILFLFMFFCFSDVLFLCCESLDKLRKEVSLWLSWSKLIAVQYVGVLGGHKYTLV